MDCNLNLLITHSFRTHFHNFNSYSFQFSSSTLRDQMGPEGAPHLGGEGRDQVAGDEEGGHVEQVDEHLVPAGIVISDHV